MFGLVKIQNAKMNVTEPEYLPATASETFNEGEALVLVGGKLTKASGTTKPEFISAKTVTAKEGEILPVSRLEPAQVWEAAIPEGVTASVGDKVTLATDGLGIADVSDSGVATVVAVAKDVVHVMFR